MSDNRRDQLIKFVEREFIGPDPIDWPGMTQSNGQEILASDPPRTRYIAGILYPAETTDDKADLKDDECELLGESDGEDVEVKPQKLGDGIVEFLEDAEELINRSNAYRQSAISITVSVKDGDAIRVAVSAGTYTKVPAMDPATGERLENKYKYPRTALAWKNDNAPLILPTPTDGLKKFPIGTTGLQFDITYRYRTDDSCIYTFTLENAKPKVKENVSDEECFFQCKFKLFSEKGFSPLSDSQRITQDEDYQSNQLLYRNVRNYAIGHGCAADWDDSESVLWITTAIFPKYDIKPIVPSAIKGVSLDMLKMSPYGSFADTIRELRMMCAKYREWINGLRTIRQDLSTEYAQRFHSKNYPISYYDPVISKYFKSISLVHKLQETRAFVGFSRAEPSEMPISERKKMLRLGSENWLPAIQVHGEGIFFEFNKEAVEEWAQRPAVLARLRNLQDSYRNSKFGANVTGDLRPEFVLIHTFAHLIINQLSFECGYGSSSIRERIYCEKAENEYGMYGVLIYTASGDSEGSLGGLVRQGAKDHIEDTIRDAVRNAAWCSSDPVCIQSYGQGPESCNLAACHNCALLPETCCECGNRLLDRGTVVGTLDNKSIGFFAELLEQ